MENGGKYDGMAAISRRGRRSISSENGGNIERENSNIVDYLLKKLARTRVARCQRKYLAAWHRLKIDWQQSAPFVRPSSKPAVRSAIKPSRSLRDFPPFRAGLRAFENDSRVSLFEIRHVDGENARDNKCWKVVNAFRREE